MANRPVFIAGSANRLTDCVHTEFQFFSGFSDAQKKRCIQSLHSSFLKGHPQWRVLEISSHSPEELGVNLSAFHLTLHLRSGKAVPVECAFQAGKVFQNGGPYLDLLDGTAKGAKKDSRLKNSGAVTGFVFEGESFPTVPRTCFYNWLYIRALNEHPELADAVMEYDAFTDIVFNPDKSLNCQAEAAAVYVALRKAGLLEEALKSKEDFIRVVYHTDKIDTRAFHPRQTPPKPAPAPKPAEEKPHTALFQPGDKIYHPTLGEGQVTARKQYGSLAILTLHFSSCDKQLDEAWVAKNCQRTSS